eukprot:gnl/TRDRNA2_/TRDRNA2_53859_c0_seq1.p1 gnl/TRDRNA2_/TRDRNA2_53859_c0~~gnl/TRDRNA2_/TRDRNA2_53859_c0_seq1.p1  ORF type:complete len:390 (+),score=71.46 gnl/TRDRNA2_/TRDRNA2_53859_c0_seq1:52-1221(+)
MKYVIDVLLTWCIFATGASIQPNTEVCDLDDDVVLLQLKLSTEKDGEEVDVRSDPWGGGRSFGASSKLVDDDRPYAKPEEPPRGGERGSEDPELTALRPDLSSRFNEAPSRRTYDRSQAPEDLGPDGRVGLEFQWSDKADNKDSPTVEQTTASDQLPHAERKDDRSNWVEAYPPAQGDTIGDLQPSRTMQSEQHMPAMIPIGRTSTMADENYNINEDDEQRPRVQSNEQYYEPRREQAGTQMSLPVQSVEVAPEAEKHMIQQLTTNAKEHEPQRFTKRHAPTVNDDRLKRLKQAEEVADYFAIAGHMIAWWSGFFEHRFTELSVQLLGGVWFQKFLDYIGVLKPIIRGLKSLLSTAKKDIVKEENKEIKELEHAEKAVLEPSHDKEVKR